MYVLSNPSHTKPIIIKYYLSIEAPSTNTFLLLPDVRNQRLTKKLLKLKYCCYLKVL